MLTILSHFSQNQATTERILEVEEMIPQSTANWCLKYLLEWDLIKVQRSANDYRGRNFKIYLMNGTTRDYVNSIERKHIEMYHKLNAKWQGETILEEEKEMILFKCSDCQKTRWAPYSSKVCPGCGSDKRIRILGVDGI